MNQITKSPKLNQSIMDASANTSASWMSTDKSEGPLGHVVRILKQSVHVHVKTSSVFVGLVIVSSYSLTTLRRIARSDATNL